MPSQVAMWRRSDVAIRHLDSWMPLALYSHPELIDRLLSNPQDAVRIRRGRRRVIRTIDRERIQAYALGQRLRQLRLERGLRQEDIAKHCGIARPNIARIERGTHLPSMKTLQRLADGLNVSLSLFLETPPADHRREDKILAESGLESWAAALDKEDRR